MINTISFIDGLSSRVFTSGILSDSLRFLKNSLSFFAVHEDFRVTTDQQLQPQSRILIESKPNLFPPELISESLIS